MTWSRAVPLRAILTGGLVAGALDILYAIVFWRIRNDVPAARILQSVASGLLGRDAYSGGGSTAALGLALHLAIATGWAALFVLAARRWPDLARRPVRWGFAYGVAVYLAMNFVVLPLSRFPGSGGGALDVVVGGVLAHLFLIGLPIALAARRFAPAP